MVDVTTRSYSNYRLGCYVDPGLQLTSENIRSNGIRLLGTYQLDDPRGTEGQVLIASGVKVRSGAIRDLALIADMSNNIYGFNAQAPFNLIWKEPIGVPMVVTKALDMWMINPTWGVLSTGVIDKSAGIWYIVNLATPDGSAAKAQYFLHAIRISDGSAAYPPLPFANATYVTASGKTKRFSGALRKQRSALSLVTKTGGQKIVYVPFGSFAETADTNLGWVIAVDVTNAPKIVDTWCNGDNYIGAGIWMAGAGPSVGDDGSLHFMTGNGGFSPPGDLGECFIKLSPELNPVQWFSPYSDAGRTGLDPTLPTDQGDARVNAAARQQMAKTMTHAMDMPGMDMSDMDMGDTMNKVLDDGGPNNAMRYMMAHMEDLVAPTSNQHDVRDQDFGSGGPLYYAKSFSGFTRNMIQGGGKDGIFYVVDADAMGNTLNADFAPDKIAGNYKKLLSPPWGATFNGMNINLAPVNLNELPIAVGGYTRHIHGQPVAYKSPDHGIMHFVQGENGPVRAGSIDGNGTLKYIAAGREIASAGMKPPGGMPGGMLSLAVTAQGENTAVLWACMPLNGDANRFITPGRICCYGANWVENNQYLIKLWDSADWGWNFMHCKFTPPTCQADKTFVPTYGGIVMIVG